MPKRGENIYKRKDGRWEGRIRRYSAVKGRYYQSLYGKSYREVKDKMYRVRQEECEVLTCKCTMAEAAQLWMQSQSVCWKAGTCSAYSQMLKKYIIPYMGKMEMRQITDRVMCEFVTRVCEDKSDKALSDNYLFQICATIRRIINYMNVQTEERIVLPKNPIVKKKPRTMILPSEKSLLVLEDYLYAHCDDDTCLGILLALHTGIRIGELSALTWNDIDLQEEILYIRKNLLRVHRDEQAQMSESVTQVVQQSPKSSDSVRAIPLPPRLICLLQKYRKQGTDYVISGVKSPWAEPRTIQYRFERILKTCHIEHFNFHMLRHAFATRCVAIGLDVKSLSEILGHSNIQMTLNLYVHPTLHQKRLLMQQYDSVIH